MCISNLNCYMFVCISNLNCYVFLSISKLNCYVFLEQTLPFVIWVASSYLSARSLSLFNSLSFSFQLALFLFSTRALLLFNLRPFSFQLALFGFSARSLSLARGVSHLSSCFISLYAIFFYLLGNQCPFFCKLTYK